MRNIAILIYFLFISSNKAIIRYQPLYGEIICFSLCSSNPLICDESLDFYTGLEWTPFSRSDFLFFDEMEAIDIFDIKESFFLSLTLQKKSEIHKSVSFLIENGHSYLKLIIDSFLLASLNEFGDNIMKQKEKTMSLGLRHDSQYNDKSQKNKSRMHESSSIARVPFLPNIKRDTLADKILFKKGGVKKRNTVNHVFKFKSYNFGKNDFCDCDKHPSRSSLRESMHLLAMEEEVLRFWHK